jgi:hypothetical protein
MPIHATLPKKEKNLMTYKIILPLFFLAIPFKFKK